MVVPKCHSKSLKERTDEESQKLTLLHSNELHGNFLDLPPEEIEKNGRPIEVATKAPDVLEEYFKVHESLKLDGEARLLIRNAPCD